MNILSHVTDLGKLILTVLSQCMLLSAECATYDTMSLNFWKSTFHTLTGNISYILPISFSFCISLITFICMGVCVCV